MHKKLIILAVSMALGAIIISPASSAAAAQAGDPDAIIALARKQAERGQFKEAESSYRKALSIDPLDTGAITGLIAVYRQQGMFAKVQLMVAQLTPVQRSALGAALKRIESTMLQDQADLRLAKGQDDQAIKYLEQAVRVDADDFQVHFKLAEQYARRGSYDMVLALLNDFLDRHPNDPETLYTLAQYQSRQGETANALKTLNRIDVAKRSREMTLLQQRLTIINLEQETRSLMQSGKKSDAVKMLTEAEAISTGNEELMLAVALAWTETGEIERGRGLLDKAKVLHTPPSVSWHLRYASFLAKTDSDRELQEELETIAAAPNLSVTEKAALYELQESAAVRIAEKQILAGHASQARQTIAPFLKQKPDQVRLLLVEARAYHTERQWQAALDIYTRILKWDRQNLEARSGFVDTLAASGGRARAVQQLDEWAADRTANEIYIGRHLSGMYENLGEYDRAKKVIDSLIANHPDATYVLYDGWKMSQRAGRVDHEIEYLQKLVVAEPYVRPGTGGRDAAPQGGRQQKAVVAYESTGIGEFGSTDKIQRDWKEKKLAGLIDRRSSWFSAAVDTRNRSGTSGLSEFNSLEIPLEYKTIWHSNDEVFFRADAVKLSAGDVDPANDRFGSMQFCQPLCTPGLLRQATQGMSFTAGYLRGDFSADIGTTPRNFPVSNTVGAIRQKGDLGEFGYSLEASRRPVTASFLSFAGTKDPNTGKVWGGVVASGARLGLSLDKGDTFGFWSSFGWHNLTGRNVQSNRRIQIMAGEQWRMLNEENRRFIIGLTGMYWNFSDNVGEYTFGHGGYYSPNKYRSLSVPITYTARSARFSYLLRGSVSASRTQMLDAQRYPTDSALQLAAGNPIYAGGPSKGTGHSLMAAWEYQFAPRLFAGGLFALDRSDYYAPNRALIYLRYSFDHPGAQPVFIPPEPMEPSSQF